MRIALATVGTTGDIRPFALLAGHLVERGHEVTAISWPVHRAALARPGVRVEVAGPHADPTRIASVAADAARHGPMNQVAVLRDFHLVDGEAHYRRLRELLPGHDLVLLHGIHSLAQAAALDLGLRWATVVFDPVLLPTKSAPPPGMPSLGPLNGLLWSIVDGAIARAGRPLNELLQRAGTQQRDLPLFRARSPLLHLVACSPAIMRVPRDLPAATRVTGAWLDRSPTAPLPEELDAFLADGTPPIAVTFGSMDGASRSVLQEALTTILDAGRRVVVQGVDVGSMSSPSLIAIGPTDHRALFPRTALVVHHGGAGTTHTACAAGVPSLVVPHVGDQRYWADRLHQLGVGGQPLPVAKLRADRLARAVLASASDRAMHERARALAEQPAQEDGIGVSVALLERAAATA